MILSKKLENNRALITKSTQSTNITIHQLNDAISGSISSVTLQSESGLWLIVIVFSYVFVLFLIFVIIWFVWYGITIKKRRDYLQRNHQSSRSTSGSRISGDLLSSGQNFLQYDYSSSSSLNRPVHNTLGLGQIGSSGISSSRYSPGTIRNNPAYNHSINKKKYDDQSSCHTASFVHSYNKHRI